jgi:hypothetical protein
MHPRMATKPSLACSSKPHLMAAKSGCKLLMRKALQVPAQHRVSDAIRLEDSCQEHARAIAELWPRVLPAQNR